MRSFTVLYELGAWMREGCPAQTADRKRRHPSKLQILQALAALLSLKEERPQEQEGYGLSTRSLLVSLKEIGGNNFACTVIKLRIGGKKSC